MQLNQRPSAEQLQAAGEAMFPGLIGIEVVETGTRRVRLRLEASSRLQAPNGLLHGGVVVGLADTACGYGCVLNLPERANGFATIELKANFLGTVREGGVTCLAELVHGGRTTQVWDATVSEESSGRPIAAFRCTQLLKYP